jgi:lysine-specific demethylase/histidyl-hydroxylase NO66
LPTCSTLDQLELLVDTDCLTPRQTVLVKDGQRAAPSTYVAGERLKPGTVRAHIERGYTLSLRRLHETVPALAAFCHILADELGHPVQANAYRTPPGAQGFRHHWDTHTAAIAQLAGHKVWQLYRPLVPAPLSPHQRAGPDGHAAPR